jgi:hypothetical protein
MAAVGYQYAIERLGLRVLPLGVRASVRGVVRIETLGDTLAVPSALAPADDVISHLLFALKHEGTNLQILAAACPQLEPNALLAALRKAPKGRYLRKLCQIWEQTTGRELTDLPAELGGATVPLFDPDRYLTSEQGIRDKRWRVTFNGLGDWSFCPSVRRTPEVEALLRANPLGQVREFLQHMSQDQLERVLAWAHLHETRSSFEIEGESPAGNKTDAFSGLLRTATERRDLDEAHLVALQNAAVTGPLAREASFRTGQNYLNDGSPGARGVTYVPPPPQFVHSLMGGISRLANLQTCPDIDALVRAALVSFGFVFVHPFMDGNGRLSRYLAHYTLCQSGALLNGTILPLSTAMKRNERAYLRALQSFSGPARALWKVFWLDAHDFSFEFEGHPAVYRYWDATDCVTFLAAMAFEALRKDLRAEVDFLSCYDKVVREVNDRFDIVGSTLAKLVVMTYQNGGVLSGDRRKQFAPLVEAAAMDFIEERMRAFSRESAALSAEDAGVTPRESTR